MIIAKSNIMDELSNIASIFPIPFYWLSLEQRYLGMSTVGAKTFGKLYCEKDYNGKTLYDLYPRNMAVAIVKSHQEAIRTNQIVTIEEAVLEPSTGKIKYFNTTIAPLNDNEGKIIGTLGIMVDITNQKEAAIFQTKSKLFEHLEMVAQILPTPLYWLDLNQKYIGINDLVIKGTGTQSFEHDFAGKTPSDLYPKNMAHEIINHHQKVIKTGKIYFAEESIKDATTKQTKHFNATIAPLRNDDGDIIGTIGTSIDITAQKESERLTLENTANKIQLQAQEEFTKTANQVAHDIRSPLASLLMIVKNCTDISEMDRIALREAAISIGDIANNLLSQYKTKDETESAANVEKQQPLLLSATLLQILTDKKYQYKELPIKFDANFSQSGQFAFIKAEPSSFKRMMSNLINNAVDALDKKEGKVTLLLDATEENVKIIVSDTGKGMPPDLIQKVTQNIAVTAGKEDGHGIGLMQVRETLERNQGKMSIHSEMNQGTQVTLEFPRTDSPSWIAEEIKLNNDDTIVILDDDSSIHMAWDMHFEAILQQSPNITLRHFENCHDAINFIQEFTEDEKQKIYLLTDYELLKQELNGLHVVEKTKIARSILVTSHYADHIILERAIKMHTKILPKQLASEIPVYIEEANNEGEKAQSDVDLVLVDDDKAFAHSVMNFLLSDKQVDYFEDPLSFKQKIGSYPKDTLIYLDNNFKSAGVLGIDLARELHALGFTKLYLLSGDVFKPGELPDYLTAIRKDDIEKISDPLK